MKRIICALLIGMLLLSAAACASGKPSGRYDIISMTYDGETITREEILAVNLDQYIEFYDDGTGLHWSQAAGGDITEAFTWDEAVLNSQGAHPCPYVLDDDTVTISENGGTLVFQKLP